MKLLVYKGFSVDFLSQIEIAPLVDLDVYEALNVLNFDVKTRRMLERALLSMDDDDERWISYEQYSLIKDRIELAIKDYDLKLDIWVNNIYPDYYPLTFDIDEALLDEIEKNLSNSVTLEQSDKCKRFLSVYNAVEQTGEKIYVSFYNYELEKSNVNVRSFYPTTITDSNISDCDIDIHITNDVSLYLKELSKIIRMQPHSVGYSFTKGAISERNYKSLCAFCQQNGISISRRGDEISNRVYNEEELINIAKNDIKIPGFESFRKLRFYKNPDISNEIVEISQSQIIGEILRQSEKAFSDAHDYRDIFITASTGAGKSVMFQIPAIYLAKKYGKLTIVIEPVKALMQDQKEQLNAHSYFRVEAFNSDLISQAEKEAVLQRVKSGDTDILYLSPETLLSYSIETLIGDRDIGLIIVDEAHIVTTWGVGFRPDYWYLGAYINKIRNQIQTKHGTNRKTMHFPICAFTATAVNGGLDDSVSETIISLYMENPIKYIGYVKRDDIGFDINVRSTARLSNAEYEDKKATDLSERIGTWENQKAKTIVYFPYASYAGDAYHGINSFSGKKYDKSLLSIYTGRNLDEKSATAQAESKRKAFDEFRNGSKPVMFATKAFGMGVDVNDINNVYHYAATGNLCDYVQEIGRAARKSGLTGCAITDYYYNDIGFMQRLFGMSQIRQYQINLVLSGIYSTYKSKNSNRSFLITPESFTYIFTGKENANNSDNQINKLKTCLLMLEKDLFDKYNFKVLISRPQGIFTKSYVVIFEDTKNMVLRSKYGKYLSYVAPGRNMEREANGTQVSDLGDIYLIDLKSIWEDHYPNISFPQFKYWYFNKNQTSPDKVDIMPEINSMFALRQHVSVETNGDVLLCDLMKAILGDFEYISDTLYNTFGKKYFSLEEFSHAISPKYGRTKARIIVNSLFQLADPKGKCVKFRSGAGGNTSVYTLSNGTFKELLNKTITSSMFMRNLKGNNNTSISKYMSLSPGSSDAIALKMLSIFDYAIYEVAGGEEPEIFIRLNDPEKIRRIISNEIKYTNSYVTKAKQKHERDVKVLRKFFTMPYTNEERWNYIENYFLGEDVLTEAETIVEEKVELKKVVDFEKSYPASSFASWEDMSVMFDENAQSTINSMMTNNIPKPDYLTTRIKHDLISGEIVMSWIEKGILIFAEPISEEDHKICISKGWKALELLTLDVGIFKEDFR